MAVAAVAAVMWWPRDAGNAAPALWRPLGGESEAVDHMMEKGAFVDIPRPELGRLLAKLPPPVAGSPRQILARRHYWKAWVLVAQNTDSALAYSLRAIALCDSGRYAYDYLRFSLVEAEIEARRGDYARAYSRFRTLIPQLHDMGDTYWEARYTTAMGRIMHDLRENHEALRYFTEASELFCLVGSDVCAAKNSLNIANTLYLLGHKQKALDMLMALHDAPGVSSDSLFMANVFISRCYISEFRDREAAATAHRLAVMMSNKPLVAKTCLTMARVCLCENSPAKALGYIREGLGALDSRPEATEQCELLEAMCEAYDRLGATDSVYEYSRLVASLKDSIFSNENIEALRRGEHLSTIHHYEEKLLHQQRENSMRVAVIAVGAVTLIILLVLLNWVLWLSRRKSMSEKHLEREKNEKLTLLNRQYELEIESKEKQLASNTLILSQKNSMLKELASHIEQLEHQGGIKAGGGESLKECIRHQLDADDDWRYFKLKFEEMHPGFFQVLKASCPSLSKTDLRLCAYLRIGMSAKEIAQTMSVLPDTVNTSRYRIRKKLGLASGDSLEQALDRF